MNTNTSLAAALTVSLMANSFMIGFKVAEERCKNEQTVEILIPQSSATPPKNGLRRVPIWMTREDLDGNTVDWPEDEPQEPPTADQGVRI